MFWQLETIDLHFYQASCPENIHAIMRDNPVYDLNYRLHICARNSSHSNSYDAVTCAACKVPTSPSVRLWLLVMARFVWLRTVGGRALTDGVTSSYPRMCRPLLTSARRRSRCSTRSPASQSLCENSTDRSSSSTQLTRKKENRAASNDQLHYIHYILVISSTICWSLISCCWKHT